MDRKVIGDKLIAAGILPNLKGFQYIIEAVDLHEPGDSMMYVYAILGKKHQVSPGSIERCIRHAHGKSEAYSKYDNSEFIALLQWELENEEAKS
jgi:hypothetical protein